VLAPTGVRVRAQVTVLRDGRTQEIDTGQLVVGDVMLFATGDILAADGMLFQGDEIRRAPPKPSECLRSRLGASHVQACDYAAARASTRLDRSGQKNALPTSEGVARRWQSSSFQPAGMVTEGRQFGAARP
jgi:hypothetical protein